MNDDDTLASPRSSPNASKKTVSFDPNSTKKEPTSGTKVTIGNTKEWNPVQTTGANLATAVTEDSTNFAETVRALTISNQVEGEMFDEKYATLPVKKKVETQVPD
jgi:hypothetical protein